MTQDVSLSSLEQCHALLEGHFLLSSGRHSGMYLQCALYLAQPQRAAIAGTALARLVEAGKLAPDLVVAPALGGLIIGHEVARALGTPFMFSERSDGAMVLRRGFVVPAAARVVVVEDVVTSGRSTNEVIALLEDAAAHVVGVCAMVDRTSAGSPFGELPFCSLLKVELPTYTPEECPLCTQGLPISKPGSRPMPLR